MDGKINTFVEHDALTAIAMQKAILVGAPVEIIKSTLSDDEINQVVDNLNKYNQDRICNDEEEVLLVALRGRDSIR